MTTRTMTTTMTTTVMLLPASVYGDKKDNRVRLGSSTSQFFTTTYYLDKIMFAVFAVML